VRNRTEIPQVFAWVKRNIEFRGEAEETLQSPEATLNYGGGDCDDFAMLLVALLESLGYDATFKVVAVASDMPAHFTHVYAVVKDKQTGQWVPLDPTVAGASAGWEPPDIVRTIMYKVRNTTPLGRLGRFGRPGRSIGRLGDDAYSATEDINAPVPIPDAVPVSGNQAFAYDLLAPFAQAGASVLAHGQTPATPPGSLNLGQLGSMLPWILVAGGVAVVFIATARK
jgi:hypothetical protein